MVIDRDDILAVLFTDGYRNCIRGDRVVAPTIYYQYDGLATMLVLVSWSGTSGDDDCAYHHGQERYLETRANARNHRRPVGVRRWAARRVWRVPPRRVAGRVPIRPLTLVPPHHSSFPVQYLPRPPRLLHCQVQPA